MHEAHKQYSLLDTIINYTFVLDHQESTHKQVKNTYYMSAGEVGFGDPNIDVFVEVQNVIQSKIWCLTNYIPDGLYLWFKN